MTQGHRRRVTEITGRSFISLSKQLKQHVCFFCLFFTYSRAVEEGTEYKAFLDWRTASEYSKNPAVQNIMQKRIIKGEKSGIKSNFFFLLDSFFK